MAHSGFVAGLVTALVVSGLAATLHDSKFVRRETKAGHVVSVGQMMESDSIEVEGVPPCDECEKYDYVLGDPDTNDCRNEHETLVADENMCRWAASQTKAHIDSNDDTFMLQTQADFIKHPYGCFHKKCHPDGDTSKPEHSCFFLNNGGDSSLSDPNSDGFAGTPVCKRKKFAEGATDAQGGCRSEYKVIMTSSTCEQICGTNFDSSFACAWDFEIGLHNYTRHHDFPKGCFHSRWNTTNSQDTVYFNPVSEGTDVEGTVLCEVETPMNFVTNPPTGVAPSPALPISN
jgi:hypothetical protein